MIVFSDQALDHLLGYDWPGNIRELKNLMEAIFLDLSADDVLVAELPQPFLLKCENLGKGTTGERERLLSALSSTNWNKSKAAHKLHWSRMTLYRKMARYKIVQ